MIMNLGAIPVTDEEKAALVAAGYPGPAPEAINKLLKDQGFTGTLSEKINKFAKSNGKETVKMPQLLAGIMGGGPPPAPSVCTNYTSNAFWEPYTASTGMYDMVTPRWIKGVNARYLQLQTIGGFNADLEQFNTTTNPLFRPPFMRVVLNSGPEMSPNADFTSAGLTLLNLNEESLTATFDVPWTAWNQSVSMVLPINYTFSSVPDSPIFGSPGVLVLDLGSSFFNAYMPFITEISFCESNPE